MLVLAFAEPRRPVQAVSRRVVSALARREVVQIVAEKRGLEINGDARKDARRNVQTGCVMFLICCF